MNKIKQFIGECKAELGKVVWPSKDEGINSTMIVVVSVMILTVVVYILDKSYWLIIHKFFG